MVIRSPADQLSLQHDLGKLEHWESQGDMEFHPSKCKVLTVSRKRKKTTRSYTLHGQTLENVNQTKYLGVTLQSDGGWDTHIAEVSNRGNRLLGFIKRNIKVKSKAIKARAYKTLLRPVLEYASAIWDPYTDSNIKDIERIQPRAARYVSDTATPGVSRR